MTLQPGTRLGPYEILSALGAGGMGEVYKARDTRLDRTVAIKVLPARLADDPQFRERFDREARAISQLTHPHICTLHDVGEYEGTAFLVMEYLEGDTLQDRLARGALPLDQALKTAIEIASALDKAHRAGIVHRDMKPGNIMLTKTGAKLLDFGLAKTAAVVQGFSASVPRGSQDPHYTPTALPTTPANLTAQGTILGTFQYMAPEQLEGQDADARTDIFAFGALVYEMLTGRKAFEGKSQASLIGAIMHAEPAPISVLQPLTPPTLDHIVRRCLAKDPDERWQSAGDVMRELKWIADTPVGIAEKARGRDRTGWTVAAVLGVVALALLASVAALYLRPAAAAQPTIQFVVASPEGWRTRTAGGAVYGLAMSPDGRRLAFIAADKDGHTMLWMRALDTAVAQPLKGTEDAGLAPVWSPDSRLLAFVAGGKLKKIDATGGPPQTIADVAYRGGAWNPDGTILFNERVNGPLSRVSATGGAVSAVTTTEPGDARHFLPYFLPDGQHFLYVSWEKSGVYRVDVGSLTTHERKPLVRDVGGQRVAYSQGRLFFMRGGALLTQAFDPTGLTISGEPSSIAEIGLTGIFSVSTSGVLAYQSGTDSHRRRFAWFDRAGRLLGAIGETAAYSGVQISPDGAHASGSILEADSGNLGDIWLYDLAGNGRTRLTFDGANILATGGIWARDGKSLVYSKKQSGQLRGDLFQKASDGAGDEEALLKDDVNKNPLSWSRDGRFLLYGRGTATTGQELWVLPLIGDRKPFPYLQTRFAATEGQFSPDGRWVAYQSNESGQNEVYAAAFPGAGGKRQISTAGGTYPRWRRDGKELLYLAPNSTLMAVAVNSQGPSLELTSVTALFETHSGGFFPYDVSADGQRFLTVSTPDDTGAAGITVTINSSAPLRGTEK